MKDELGTQMRAVGEVMSIGKTYKEAFQKAIRSLEQGCYGLGFVGNYHEQNKEELLRQLNTPSSKRQFIMYEALRKGATIDEIHERTKIKDYFIEQMLELVDEENKILTYANENPGKMLPDKMLEQAKKDGFADRYLSQLMDIPEKDIREARIALGITEAWEGVHVSSTQDSAYYYSTYNAPDHSTTTDAPKVMILGGGPNRIGQGIEFDYCCVHASIALKKLGFETIIVNCNPETVSTDYDTSDKLYFEPLTTEDVLSIYEKEKPLGVIAQFGGQTPLNLSAELKAAGVNILGTSPEIIDLAEDRDRFRAMMDELGIPMPESDMAVTVDDALAIAHRIGYPVMVRPSYVLGGRGMEVVYDDAAAAGDFALRPARRYPELRDRPCQRGGADQHQLLRQDGHGGLRRVFQDRGLRVPARHQLHHGHHHLCGPESGRGYEAPCQKGRHLRHRGGGYHRRAHRYRYLSGGAVAGAAVLPYPGGH